MTKLSDAALVLLGKAAQRDDRLAELPNHLPAAARNSVVRSLLKQGLLIEDAVPLNHPMAWRTEDTAADGDNGDAVLRCSIALRLCTIPVNGVLDGDEDLAGRLFEARILRPLAWFGLLDVEVTADAVKQR